MVRNKIGLRQRKIAARSLLFLAFFSLSISILTGFVAYGTPGAIWTTLLDCSQIQQNINEYHVGDNVYIHGDSFPVGTYPWHITGQPHSGDPSTPVASGTVTVGADGTFCFWAYKVQPDDWGVYKYGVGGKNDNYHVVGVGCTLTDVQVSITGPDCDGWVTLSATPVGGVGPFTYEWLDNGTTIGTTKLLLVQLSVGTHSITVTVTSTSEYNCWVESTSQTVTVYPPPSVSVDPLSGELNCSNNHSILLTATVTAGTGKAPFSYQWYKDSSPVGTNSPTYTATAAGSYTVEVTDANSCTDTSDDPAELTEIDDPVVTISPLSGELNCSNNHSILLTATVTAGTGKAPFSYQWYKDSSPVGTNSPTYTATAAGSYTVEVIDANSCTDTSDDPAELTEIDDPVVTISPLSGELNCSNNHSILLTATVTAGTGKAPFSYQWYKDSSPVGTNSPTYTATAAGSYTVEVTDANSCTDTSDDPAELTEIDDPVVTISPLSGELNCSNNHSILLTATVTAGTGKAPFSYQWYKDSSPVGTNSPTYTATAAGSYTVEVIDANSCTDTSDDPAELTEIDDPVVTISPLSGELNCSNNHSILLTATVTAGTGKADFTYEWYKGATLVATHTPISGRTDTLNVSEPGTYTVKVIDANGCDDTSDNSVTVTEVDDPEVLISSTETELNCSTTSIELTATVTTGTGKPDFTYEWYKGATLVATHTPISGRTDTLNVSEPGTYTVKVIDANGCYDTSDNSVTVTEVDCIDLSLTKDVSPTSYSVGDEVTFTITVANAAGYSDATGVKVSDILPSGYTYVSHGGGTYVPGTGIWTVGNLADGASASLDINATVLATGEYTNYAQVESATETDVDSTPGNDSTTEDDDDTAGVTPANPGIDIEKSTNGQDADSAPGPSIAVGDPITWTYVVTNTGNVTLTNIVVTDNVLGAVGTIASLAPGASQTLTKTGTAAAGQYANTGTATVIFGDITYTDSDDSHYFGANPSIAIEKTPDTQQVISGTDAMFHIRVENTGDVPLTNVVISDLFAPNCASVTIGTLAVGAVYEYDCVTPNVTTGFVNEAIVTGEDPSGNPVTDTDTARVVIITSSISVVKEANVTTANVGDTVTYTYRVTNTGDGNLSNITLVDDKLGAIPLGTTTLGPGESITVTANYTVQTTDLPGPVVNVATATGTDSAGNTVTDEAQETVDITAGGGGATEDTCEGRVVINEVAWAGTAADSRDEWIELRNLGTIPVDLTGWTLRWRRKQPTTEEEYRWKVVNLSGILLPGSTSACELADKDPTPSVEFIKRDTDDISWWILGKQEEKDGSYYTIERRHDETISNEKADLLYDMAEPYEMDLTDLGDVIELINDSGEVVDTANASNPERDGWPAGSAATFATMERTNPLAPDTWENWHTNLGIITRGLDAKERPLIATADVLNSQALEELALAAQLAPTKTRAGARLEVGLDLPREDRKTLGWPWIRVTRPDLAEAAGGGGAVDYGAGVSFSGRYSGDLYWLGIDTGGLSPGQYNIWIVYGEGKAILVPILVLQ